MTPPVGSTPPGWYPDPWKPGGTRWWDGTAWTGQAGPSAPVPPASLSALPPPPRQQPVGAAVATERTLRPWAKAAVVVLPVALVIVSLGTVAAFRDLGDQIVEEFEAASENRTASVGSSFEVDPISGIFGPLQLGALVVVGLWAMRAAEVGRSLGRPATRSPGWAIGGLFIPIVNFWFPYQSIVESLDQRTDRGPVLWWWVAHVLSQLWTWAAILLAFLDVPFVVLGAVGVGLAILVGGLGLRAVDHVSADHDAAVAVFG